MSGLVAEVKAMVHESCVKARCRKEGCSASMEGLPPSRVLVDLDCDALSLPKDSRRCDYVYLDEDSGALRLVPIEIKTGGIRASDVVEQLQAGATLADQWIPQGASPQLIPVLVHRKGLHREEAKALRSAKINGKAQTKTIRCGASLKNAL